MNIFFKILCFIFLLFKTTALFSEDTKIKIGVLAPLSGENSDLGKQIISSIRMALVDINDDQIEIYPKDTRSDPNIALRSAFELQKLGITLIIGPVFHKNLLHLHEIENITFLSLTNKTLDLPKNIISSGTISTYPKGKNGFGYDPIFIPKKRKQTFGEMKFSSKRKIDHRSIAFKKIKKFL